MSCPTLSPSVRRVVGILAVALVPMLAGGEPSPGPDPSAGPQRIVSLAPSLTETLFALGLGDRVVGVSRFCDFPPEARTRPRVGGYLDPDYEAIVALRPDLVALIEPQRDVEQRLAALGVRTVRVDQGRVATILRSFEELAAACGVPERGRRLRAATESRLEALRRRSDGPAPRVLLAVERPAGTGRVTSIWAAAPGTFLDDLLGVAGAVNAVPAGPAPFPELSREGLLALDPDVILDLQPDLAERGLDADVVARDWRALDELRAVRAHRVHVIVDDAAVVPGPRLADAVESISRAVFGTAP